MLKKTSSFVLAALRGSTYRRVRLLSSLTVALLGQGASLGEEAVLAYSGRAGAAAASGWAGEKPGLFEHPVWCLPVIPDVLTSGVLACPNIFSAAY